MSTEILVCVTAGVPLLAVVLEWIANSDLSERHHRNHDTYVVSGILLRTLVMTMAFMGILGLVLAWLCDVGVFEASPPVLLSFFAAFLGVSLVILLALRHYQVVTFDDRMHVTPFLGRRREVLYKDIERMEWSRPNSLVGYQSVRVWRHGDDRPITLWGTLDVEQILMRVNRFDVLENPDLY